MCCIVMDTSEEELFLLDSILTKTKRLKKCGPHPNDKKRMQHGEYHHLFSGLKEDDDRFFEYCRMTKETFYYVLEKVEDRLSKTWCNFHQIPILPEERLVITLRFLATGTSFRSLAVSFRTGSSTISKIIAETVSVLWEELQPIHMAVPSEQDFRSIAEQFQNVWDFPNCLGAVDGIHIRVKYSTQSGYMYFNHKKYFSLVLQAVADAKYKFIVIDTGKQSDGGVFESSQLGKALKENSLNIPQSNHLPGTTTKAPFVFIGDDAYPLLPYLLRPFGGKKLSTDKERFNARLSRARKTVECAFSIMTSKWRLLNKYIETDVLVTDKIIKCICILHNTIIDKEGCQRHFSSVSLEHQGNQQYTHSQQGRPQNAGKAVRDIFLEYFKNCHIVDN